MNKLNHQGVEKKQDAETFCCCSNAEKAAFVSTMVGMGLAVILPAFWGYFWMVKANYVTMSLALYTFVMAIALLFGVIKKNNIALITWEVCTASLFCSKSK